MVPRELAPGRPGRPAAAQHAGTVWRRRGDFLHTLAVVEEIARALATGVTGFTTIPTSWRRTCSMSAPRTRSCGICRPWRAATRWPRWRSPSRARAATSRPSAARRPASPAAICSTARRPSSPTAFTPTACWWRPRPIRPRARGISLFWVDAATPGFTRGRLLDKVGQRAQDTAELFFQDVLVPDADLLGEPGQGFGYDEGTGARTADDRRALRHGAGKRAAMDGGLRQAAPGVRQGAARQPVHPLQAGRYQDAGRRHPRIRRRLRAPVPGRRAGRAGAAMGCGRPRPPAPSTICCSSTAATATCANTRSAGRTRTSGRTGGASEIMRELIARTL